LTQFIARAAAMRQQIAYGVDGIITNYPTLLRGVLAYRRS